MLKIRKEQYEAFQPEAEATFAVRVEQHLREHHGKAIVKLPGRLTLVGRMSMPDLRKLVEVGITRARAHGFTFASSIGSFVVLMFKIAPNFDQHPAVRDALAQLGSEEQRLQRVLDSTSSEVWQEIKERYDPEAWTMAKGAEG